MVNYNYTKADLIDAIVQARMSYLPWAHILAQEIDKLTVEVAFMSKVEEKKSTWGEDPSFHRKYTLAGLSENKENE